MKNLLKYIYIISIVILVTGCKSKLTDLNGNVKESFKINETAVYNNINYTITNVEYLDKNNNISLEISDNLVIAITYQIKNNSNEEYSIRSLSSLFYNGGNEIGSYSYTSRFENPSLESYNLAPGQIYIETDYFELSNIKENKEFLLLINAEKDIRMYVDLNNY